MISGYASCWEVSSVAKLLIKSSIMAFIPGIEDRTKFKKLHGANPKQ